MTVQTTSNLTNSVRTQYLDIYHEAADFQRVYDICAVAAGKPYGEVMNALEKGSSIQLNFLSDLAIATSNISQVADLNPATLRDATASVTPVSRANAIQWSQQLDIQNYTNYAASRFQKIGKNMMESVDWRAAEIANTGNLLKRAAARASLDAGTTAHNLSEAVFAEMETLIQVLKVPAFLKNGRPQWYSILHPEAYYDLRTSGNVESVGLYQKSEIILNWELGALGPFKIMVTPWAKVFGAAGVDHASNVDTTLSSAANALAKTIVVASATNITSGDYLTIGTEETGGTFQPVNERVKVSDAYVSGTTIDIIGEGANGGLRFDHASAVAVRNADTVFPVLFAGPESMAKVYATEVGEYGEIVGPKEQGLVNQFSSLGWKWFGGYGLWTDSSLSRAEVSSSLES